MSRVLRTMVTTILPVPSTVHLQCLSNAHPSRTFQPNLFSAARPHFFIGHSQTSTAAPVSTDLLLCEAFAGFAALILLISACFNASDIRTETHLRYPILSKSYPNLSNYHLTLKLSLRYLDHQPHPSLDLLDLPLHSHQSYLDIHNTLELASTVKEKATIAKQSGIQGPPILWHVASLDYSKSFLYGWMHFFLENVVSTLINLWSECFKDLNSGFENYEILGDAWIQIGAETTAAIKDIPAAFVQVLENLAVDHYTFTAEA
ncbi:hypothetical protein DFH29DRAFT_1010338 [Suillus ampliporus]|nr:hypothetical protein DFH29DRAFT_1010338 [Suillus ampliporus]